VRLTPVAEKLRSAHLRWIGSALRRPFASLPSRFIVSVFAAALVTSLAVTWISTRSIESFLRAKIDQKFPAILLSTSERLDLWYSQRELDLGTFASSATVMENLGRLPAGDRDTSPARVELATYLSYVLERFPQYETLFLLEPDGVPLLRVGEAFEFPEAHLRPLAAVASAWVGDIQKLEGRRVQVASAPIQDARGRRLASLHALVRLGAVEEVLRSSDLGPSGGIYLVGRDGEVLLRLPGSAARERHTRALPAVNDSPVVEDYSDESGLHVVGSAVAFTRFGWTIVVEEAYDEAFAPVVVVIREILGINLGIVLTFGLIAYQMARSIVRPILALSDGALRIATGETDVVISGATASDEIGVLTRAFNKMSSRLRENQNELEESRLEVEDANARLIAQNQELQRVSEVFQQLSITDDLTKLHNHRFFQNHLPREIKRSERTGEPLSLILIDIDDFKALNDRFGHSVGDVVLRKVSDVMNQSVREMDLLARYGGEEFALLAGRTDLEGAIALAEKIRLAIARSRFSVVDLDGPQHISITASFGVAQYRGDEKAFFNEADRALYRAKNAGKDCVCAAEDS
jgi:diguanylate cyclase (GGDEF)-like protein